VLFPRQIVSKWDIPVGKHCFEVVPELFGIALLHEEIDALVKEGHR
jgi:hypothetical protein